MTAHRFSSTDHLGPEAVAAYVDHELSAAAYRRAQQHLTQCPECHEEVVAQRGAAQRVRVLNGDDEVKAPSSLVARLAGLTEAEAGAECAPSASGARAKVEEALRTLLGRDRPRE